MPNRLRHREFIGYQVYTAQRALMRSLDLTLSPFGLTSSQWNALNQLHEYGDMTQKELAEHLDKEPATVARLLDRLVKRGLVQRTSHPEDRRANIIGITPAAVDLLVAIEPHAAARADRIAEGISDEHLNIFFSVLDTIRQNAERSEEQNTTS